MHQIISSQSRIGWIGTGVMGAAMCGHLLDAGHRLTVHTRTEAKARPLLERGAAWADSPGTAAAASDVTITMVGFPADVRQVYFEPDGILARATPGSIVIDMTTTAPSLSRDIAQAAAGLGLHAIDAPVSGGDVGARQATLSIMVGGEAAIVEAVRPLFERMGKRIVHQGGPGCGQHAKLCNQVVIAGAMIGVCESLLYGRAAGLNVERLLHSVSGGAAACWTLDHLAPKIAERRFEPGFFVEHFIKDMGIALEEATRMGIALPGLTLVRDLYQRVLALGHGRSGTHALILALEALSPASLDRAGSR